MDALALIRLLQLASPTLPVGAYTYSQGLEWAVEAGTVRDAESAGRWVRGVLAHSVASFEAPLLVRLLRAWSAGDAAAVRDWNERFIASRETAELRAETLQMGYSCARLLRELDALPAPAAALMEKLAEVSFPAAWSGAASAFGIGEREALAGYLWGWLENQVMAAVKAVPLGQSAGQRLLGGLGAEIPGAVERALEMADDEMANFAPALAIASSRHESQYSRLFRS